MCAVVGLRSKRARIIAVVAVALVVVFCALTARLFVFPDLNTPARSDAIVVLGGFGLGPVDKAVALAEQGLAPTIVFSLEPTLHCVSHLPSAPKVRVLCFRANPLSTRGEARAIARLAAQYHWHRIMVVMPTAQATRARLRIGRCYPGQVLEVGVPASGIWDWTRAIAYEWAALAKALVLQPSC
jgi:uncharacterized SAM-binding protein YcdF (DUF218 family)